MCLKNKIIYTKIDIQKFDKHTKKLITKIDKIIKLNNYFKND